MRTLCQSVSCLRRRNKLPVAIDPRGGRRLDVRGACRAIGMFRRARQLTITIHPGASGQRLRRIGSEIGSIAFEACRRQRKDCFAAAIVEDRVAFVNRAQGPSVAVLADPKTNDVFTRLVDKYADGVTPAHDSTDQRQRRMIGRYRGRRSRRNHRRRDDGGGWRPA